MTSFMRGALNRLEAEALRCQDLSEKMASASPARSNSRMLEANRLMAIHAIIKGEVTKK